ncbi:MAG: protein kinase domain-containing protein, partial [Trebonia sp.]
LDIVAQSARALEAAHRAGIVHRDIKPGNLLIMSDGTAKITDFGIAKANAPDVSLTQTGLVMGTALYVSPEQATGQPLDGSSDVYSLGVVAYECLAGDPPFVAEQPLAIAIMHKHDPVPPLPDDVPPPIADLVYAMLAKEPRDRPRSARHVAERAEVIREARHRNGYNATTSSNLAMAPGAAATSMDIYRAAPDYHGATERLVEPRTTGNRAFLLAGTGAAAVGVVAIIAVLVSSNGGSGRNVGSNTTLPTQTQSQAATTGAQTGTATGTGIGGGSNAGNPGNGVIGTAVGTTSARATSARATSATSGTPTKSSTPTKPAATTHAPTSSAPTSSAPTSTVPTSSAPTSTAPTSSAPTSTAPTSSAPSSSTPATPG